MEPIPALYKSERVGGYMPENEHRIPAQAIAKKHQCKLQAASMPTMREDW